MCCHPDVMADQPGSGVGFKTAPDISYLAADGLDAGSHGHRESRAVVGGDDIRRQTHRLIQPMISHSDIDLDPCQATSAAERLGELGRRDQVVIECRRLGAARSMTKRHGEPSGHPLGFDRQEDMVDQILHGATSVELDSLEELDIASIELLLDSSI